LIARRYRHRAKALATRRINFGFLLRLATRAAAPRKRLKQEKRNCKTGKNLAKFEFSTHYPSAKRQKNN
jgi:hypothetical protein